MRNQQLRATNSQPRVLALCLGFIWLACNGAEARAAEIDFEPASEFLKLPEGWTLGNCSAVAVNRRGDVYLFHRGKHPLICFDASGIFLRAWGDDVIETAHGLRVDREDNVWVTDIGNHRVFKFDPAGKLLMSLGTGKPGAAANEFNKPTDVAFGVGGEFFVSDGYENTRVLKFSAGGKLLKTWGTAGKGPGEFNLPHAIIVDSKGRVLVGDRENNRIQIFDDEGRLLKTWPGFAPYGLAYNSDGVLFVADGRAHQVHCLDDEGQVKKSWGKKGAASGEFNLPHMLAFDGDGNLYVAEVGGKRLQKFMRK